LPNSFLHTGEGLIRLLVDKHEVTQLLLSWSRGDRSALDQLTPILYDELRRLAAAHLRRA